MDKALDDDHLSENEPELVTRLKDVELRTYSMQKQARTIAALQAITTSIGLVTVGQRASGDSTLEGGGESHLNYRADIAVSLPGGEIGYAKGSLFSQFRLGQGGGMQGLRDTFTSPNATTFQISGPPSDSTAMLAQAWYQFDIPLGGKDGFHKSREKLVFNAGKMDPFLFFDQNAVADDEITRFINSGFVHNPLLDAGGDAGMDNYGFSPGMRLAYRNETAEPEWWGLSVGMFAAGPGAAYNDSFRAPFVITQLETGRKFFGGLSGNYRLYHWSNGQATRFRDGVNFEDHSGWGLSADQRIGDAITLFGRFGASTQGHVKFDRAVTLGTEVWGTYWSRSADAVGIALGGLRPSDDYQQVNPGHGAIEKQLELYYRWRLNPQLALTPDLQLVRNPAGDETVKTVWFAGVRAVVTF